MGIINPFTLDAKVGVTYLLRALGYDRYPATTCNACPKEGLRDSCCEMADVQCCAHKAGRELPWLKQVRNKPRPPKLPPLRRSYGPLFGGSLGLIGCIWVVLSGVPTVSPLSRLPIFGFNPCCSTQSGKASDGSDIDSLLQHAGNSTSLPLLG